MRSLSFVQIGVIWLALLAGFEHVYPQEYRWPIDASRHLTSTFGEYRPRHLHAGIDIKTWGREGYPVYAVESGYIWRIKISPYGYGKALYLRLNTGETAVYAHLQRFAARIQKIAEEEQQRTGKFSIDKYLSPFALPVRKGECIAYSGKSAAKAPHLHFELRDEFNRPVNPLAKGFFIRDSIPPTITGISILPLEYCSEVDGDFQPKVFNISEGQRVLKDTVQVWGKIGIGVSAYDRANGAYNRFSIYKTELYVDEVLIFRRQYDRFDYSTTQQVELDRDYRLWRWGWGLFYQLFHQPGNTLPFYGPFGAGAGILRSPVRCPMEKGDEYPVEEGGVLLSKGYHRIQVKVYDFYDNQTELIGTLLVNKKPEIELIAADKPHVMNVATDLAIRGDRPIKKIKLRCSLDGGWTWIDAAPEVLNLSSTGSPLRLLPEVREIDGSSLEIIEITATDSLGTDSFPVYKFFGRSSNEELKLSVKKQIFDRYLRLQLLFNHPLIKPPQVLFSTANASDRFVKMYTQNPRQFVGTIPLNKEIEGFMTIEVSAKDIPGREKTFHDYLEVKRITPQEGGVVASWDKRCRIYFGRDAVYRPLLARLYPVYLENRWGYDIVAEIYTAEPFDIPLKKKVWVEMNYPLQDPSPDKLGIYFLDDADEWEFLGNVIDKQKKTVGAPALSLEKFTLIRDVEPPEIPWVFPADGSRIRNRYPRIKALVRDELSGIGGEEDIIITLDGRKLIAEYDPEREQVLYQTKTPLRLGKHRLSVWVRDRSGNVAERLIEFWVVGNRR